MTTTHRSAQIENRRANAMTMSGQHMWMCGFGCGCGCRCGEWEPESKSKSEWGWNWEADNGKRYWYRVDRSTLPLGRQTDLWQCKRGHIRHEDRQFPRSKRSKQIRLSGKLYALVILYACTESWSSITDHWSPNTDRVTKLGYFQSIKKYRPVVVYIIKNRDDSISLIPYLLASACLSFCSKNNICLQTARWLTIHTSHYGQKLVSS